jgi:hypothetical protein
VTDSIGSTSGDLPRAFQGLHFLRASLSVLARLVDERGGRQLHGIEITDCEAIEPSLTLTGVAPQSSAASVPLRDVDAIGPALTEQHDGHERRVYGARRTESKSWQKSREVAARNVVGQRAR